MKDKKKRRIADMTSARETVKRAIEFGGPEWIPYQLGISTGPLESCNTPAEIAAMEKALLDIGASQSSTHARSSAVPWSREKALLDMGASPWIRSFVAQELFVAVNPTSTTFPEPYRPLEKGEWVDEWGVIWANPDFPFITGHPLEAGWELLDAYRLPDPCAPGRYEEARRAIAQHPDRYRLGHVWFTLFERLWSLRGFNNMMIDPYIHPEEFVRLRDLILEFNLVSIKQQLELGVDGIFFSDDWGSQTSLLMNPDDWRKWYKPQYKRMFDAVHEGGAHIWMHLCGNVMAIIPDLIEAGLDVLNPVQPQAMDVDLLASRFGGRLCFFGGADVQGTLPHGTPLDVENEVKHLISIFGSHAGGYIGGTSHSILPDTPLENIIALFRTFKECSGIEAR